MAITQRQRKHIEEMLLALETEAAYPLDEDATAALITSLEHRLELAVQ